MRSMHQIKSFNPQKPPRLLLPPENRRKREPPLQNQRKRKNRTHPAASPFAAGNPAQKRAAAEKPKRATIELIIIDHRRKKPWLQLAKIAVSPWTKTTGPGREKPAGVGLVIWNTSGQKKAKEAAILSHIALSAAASTFIPLTNPDIAGDVQKTWQRRLNYKRYTLIYFSNFKSFISIPRQPKHHKSIKL